MKIICYEFFRLIVHYNKYDYPFLTQAVSSNWGVGADTERKKTVE